MAGNKDGLQSLIKRSAQEAMWTHCMIHRESLATKELCPELSEGMDAVIRTVNYTKICLLNTRIFCRIMRGNGGPVSVTPILL
jgi:hypothetical protein